MVFVFGIDIPLTEFLVVLAILNVFNLAVVVYIVLKLREEIRSLRGVPRQ